MNIFVLSTGRCASVTFAKACRHILNYTVLHESRCSFIGDERLAYPENHIEVDNRLSWFLDRLDKIYGDNAFYVHLIRDKPETANSFNKRWNNRTSIIRAYCTDILEKHQPGLDVCMDYCDTANANISLFLKDKSKKMIFSVEKARQDFSIFWEKIGAEGNIDKALNEWKVKYNASEKQYSQTNEKNIVNELKKPESEIIQKASITDTSEKIPFPSPIVQINIQAKNRAYKVNLPEKETFRVKEIFKNNEYSILKQRSHRGPLTVFDVGANVGLFAIYMKIIDPQCIIHCFEPAGNTQKLLLQNVGNIPGIHCYPYGLYNEDTETMMNIHSLNTGQYSVKIKNVDHKDSVKVMLKNSNKEFENLRLDHLDVLKIDTEGCEVEILESLESRLGLIDYILIEYHSDTDRRKIDNLLNGFTMFSAKSAIIGYGTSKYINTNFLSRYKITIR